MGYEDVDRGIESALTSSASAPIDDTWCAVNDTISAMGISFGAYPVGCTGQSSAAERVASEHLRSAYAVPHSWGRS